MRNGIIIPCYNEASRLQFQKFESFIKTNTNYTICFVNDGSKDKTLNELLRFRRGKEDQVLVYDLPQNSGKAEAVRSGCQYLLQNTNVQTIGFLDADLSTDFNDYKMLVNHMDEGKGLEMVFGSRNMNDGISGEIKRNPLRKMLSNFIGMLIKMIVGLPINDTQCGAKIFKRDMAGHCFSSPFISRWLFDIELFIRMKKRYGVSKIVSILKEVPLKRWVHVEGSKLGLKDSLNIPFQLSRIAIQYRVKPAMSHAYSGFKMSLGIF